MKLRLVLGLSDTTHLLICIYLLKKKLSSVKISRGQYKDDSLSQ